MTAAQLIFKQIGEALDNSIDNGYEHEYNLSPQTIVEEINDQAGIQCYDPSKEVHVLVADCAVVHWRLMNPKEG